MVTDGRRSYLQVGSHIRFCLGRGPIQSQAGPGSQATENSFQTAFVYVLLGKLLRWRPTFELSKSLSNLSCLRFTKPISAVFCSYLFTETSV